MMMEEPGMSAHMHREKPNFNGEGEIWLQELDLDSWKLKGERFYLWRGACAGTWAEGPHIYKRDGRYYLLIAGRRYEFQSRRDGCGKR